MFSTDNTSALFCLLPYGYPLSSKSASLFIALGLRLWLAPRKGQVLVLDHVLYLPLHGYKEEDTEVHQKDGPKDRDIYKAKKGEDKGYTYCAHA